MTYLSVENLSKKYGYKTLFEGITFGISKGDKTALIAQNGTGKSTLLKMVAGVETPDGGEVITKNGLRVSLLQQEPNLDDELTINEFIIHGDNEMVRIVRDYEIAVKAQSKNYTEKTQKIFDKALAQMDAYNAWDYELRLQQILAELKVQDLNQKISSLSGGQRKRVALAFALLDEPDFLILDEPTNHLDIEMIEWLEKYLSKSTMTLLMVTHDRYFLDRVCNHIIEIENGYIYHHKGYYNNYLLNKEEREKIYATEVSKAGKLAKKELEWVRKQPKARTTKSKSRLAAYHETEKKANSGKIKNEIKLEVGHSRIGGQVLELKSISKRYGDNKILDQFNYSFNKGEKIGIIGKNGVGKSTLLNIITGNVNIDHGQVLTGQTIVYGHYKQNGHIFKENDRVIDVVKEIAEVIQLANGDTISASQFLEHFMFDSNMQYTPVAKLSGGERRRLGLMMVLIKNPNFLILDEPTNDLDLITLEKLESFLADFRGCLLIVSHDRYFMDNLVEHYFVFEGNGVIRDFNGTYDEYKMWKEREKIAYLATKKKKVASNKEIKSHAPSLSYAERKELNKLEKEIFELEEKKQLIENEMHSSISDYEKLNELSIQCTKVKERIEEKEMLWLELSERA